MGRDKLLSTLAYALGIAFSASASAQSVPSQAASTSNTSSNGSSTGVGNAGSFGIGSGTSDSLSTATAISNGVTDNSVDNSVNNSTNINVLAEQDLQASNTNNQLSVIGSFSPGAPVMQTGSNSLSHGAFANYTGVLTAGWNTAPSGIGQAATNLSVNGSIGAK